MLNPPTMATVAEAAELLGLAKMTVYRLMNKGDLVSYRIGGRRLIDRDSLVAYSAQQTKLSAVEIWLTVGEIAAVLRVSRMSVYRLTESGDLSSKRIGRMIHVRQADFDAYVVAQRMVPRLPQSTRS